MRAHSHPPHPRIDPSITGQYEVILQEPAVSGVQQKTDKMYLFKMFLPGIASGYSLYIADLAYIEWLEFHQTE